MPHPDPNGFAPAASGLCMDEVVRLCVEGALGAAPRARAVPLGGAAALRRGPATAAAAARPGRSLKRGAKQPAGLVAPRALVGIQTGHAR